MHKIKFSDGQDDNFLYVKLEEKSVGTSELHTVGTLFLVEKI